MREKMSPKKKKESQISSWCTNFTALGLVMPGVGLYVYIIYIIASKLVYPATFFPFTQSHTSEGPVDKFGMLSIYEYN